MRYSKYTDIVSKATFNIAGFKQALITANIWDKLDIVNLSFGGDSALLNLKDDSVIASLGNDRSYYEDNVGFFTDGVSGFIEYDWKPTTVGNNYALNSAYLGVFQWLPITENGYVAGVYSVEGIMGFNAVRNNDTIRFNINCSNKTIPYTGDTDGYFSFSKTDNSVAVSRNGSVLDTVSVTTTGLPDAKLNACGLCGGSAFSFNKVGVIITGSYLTPEEDAILYNALNDLMLSKMSLPEFYKSGNLKYSTVSFSNKTIFGNSGNKIIAGSSTHVWLSLDGGETWVSKAIDDPLTIRFVLFWDSGTITFANNRTMYRTDDNLSTLSEISPKLPNGDSYTLHTPADSDEPGTYYAIVDTMKKMYLNGEEVFMWGNYANAISYGASPINIYQLKNDGEDLVVIYQFGQNEYRTDDGTNYGGVGGTLLGDASNDIKCRHIHSTCWDEENKTLYFCTGDHDQPWADDLIDAPFYECHWGKIVLTPGSPDIWTPTIIHSDSYYSPYKAIGMNLIEGYIYYASDEDSPDDAGIYKVKIEDIADISKHIQLLHTVNESVTLIRDRNKLLATEFAGSCVFNLSKDLGATWETVPIVKVPGYPLASMLIIGMPDNDGYNWYYHSYLFTTMNLRIKAKIV